jgi:single-strand DNA-binding protein
MFNKAILVGRLTAEPELRQTQSGVPVISFSVACQRPYVNGGERKTDFINVDAWRRSAEFVAKYFHKGNAIGVDGRIEMRDYTDRDGNNRRAFEVIADNIFFVEGRSASTGGDMPAYAAPAQAAAPSAPVSYSSGSVEDFQEVDLDDDLPF